MGVYDDDWQGTREGWAHNDQAFLWELHDVRGHVRAWITGEAVAAMLRHPAEHRWRVQDTIIGRFGVPLPLMEAARPYVTCRACLDNKHEECEDPCKCPCPAPIGADLT